MTIAFHTGASEPRPCDRCGTVLPHRESKALVYGVEKTWWSPGKHIALCGLPCISGGVKPVQIRGDGVHGYQDRCPKCGPLRVLPEVVAEMRYRAEVLERALDLAAPLPDTGHWQGCRCDDCHAVWLRASTLQDARVAACLSAQATRLDLLRALTQIEKLTAERDEARQALAILKDGIDEAQADAQLDAELEQVRVQCAEEGHTPAWVRCDYWSEDADYRCARCGKLLPEPEGEIDAEIAADEAKGEIGVEALCAENPISPSHRHEDDL